MNNEEIRQLDLLAVFHFVVGGITALCSCMPFMHVFMGLMLLSQNSSNASEEQFIGLMFVIMGSVFILMGWIIAICIISAGFKLKARCSRMYCMVIAGIECMFMPFGTVLGVFTLILLNKESVRQLFEGPPVSSAEN